MASRAQERGAQHLGFTSAKQRENVRRGFEAPPEEALRRGYDDYWFGQQRGEPAHQRDVQRLLGGTAGRSAREEARRLQEQGILHRPDARAFLADPMLTGERQAARRAATDKEREDLRRITRNKDARQIQQARLSEERGMFGQDLALDLMRQRALGQNLIADQMAAAQTERAGRQAMAQLAAGRGGFNPAAQRAAAYAGADAAAQIGQQAGIQGMQEQLAAEQALMGAGTQMRQSGLGRMGLEQQIAAQDIAQRLQAEQMGMGFYQMAMQDKYNALASQQALEQMRYGRSLNAAQLAAGQQAAAAQKPSTFQTVMGTVGSVLPGVGMLAQAFSDRRSKTNVKKASSPLRELLKKTKPYEYDYTVPEVFGHGRRVGVMAQDLERSSIGRNMVSTDPATGMKVVDYSPDKFNPLVLAGLSDFNKRLEKLEKR